VLLPAFRPRCDLQRNDVRRSPNPSFLRTLDAACFKIQQSPCVLDYLHVFLKPSRSLWRTSYVFEMIPPGDLCHVPSIFLIFEFSSQWDADSCSAGKCGAMSVPCNLCTFSSSCPLLIHGSTFLYPYHSALEQFGSNDPAFIPTVSQSSPYRFDH
jgi:hypothetical protein